MAPSSSPKDLRLKPIVDSIPTGSEPRITDWQTRNAQLMGYRDASNRSPDQMDSQMDTTEILDLRMHTTPLPTLLVPYEVPRGGTRIRESARPHVALGSNGSYPQERRTANPMTMISSTFHETVPGGCLGTLVTTELIPTVYPPSSNISQMPVGVSSIRQTDTPYEEQLSVRLPSIQNLLCLPQPARNAENWTSMTSESVPSLNVLPQGCPSGQSSRHQLMEGEGEQPLAPQETQSELSEQPRQPLSAKTTHPNWQQERLNSSMTPAGSSLHQQESGVEPQPFYPRRHGHEAKINWLGHVSQTSTANPHVNSSVPEDRSKRKHILDILHEAPRPSKRTRIAREKAFPGNQTIQTADHRSGPSKESSVTSPGPAPPTAEFVNVQTRTSAHYLSATIDAGGATKEVVNGTREVEESGRAGVGSVTDTEPGGGFFRDARGVVMHQPIMVDRTQNVYVQGDRSEEALPWLLEYIMRGAKFDSSDRDPPPRCHPGTRTTIIDKIHHWLEDPHPEKKLLWLRGLAGVGKSAIVQTLAEKLSEQGRLGASLFFSRPNGRTDPRQVFPTLAYQFAVQNPSYKAYITELKLKDPQSLETTTSEQFRLLITVPFGRNIVAKTAWVVALDGLDECGGDDVTRRHSDHTQREIVRLVSEFVSQYPSTPLIWMIASRPETHLKALFCEDDVKPILWEEDVPIDSPEACRDVEKFLHHEFTKIRKHYPDHIQETLWPANDQFLRITTAASGLFIFAQVIIHFVDDSVVGNPITQLRCVISIISRVPLSQLQRHPLAVLDAIYGEILSRIPRDLLKVAKDLITSLILFDRKSAKTSDINLSCICNFLIIERDDAITSLRHLHSVLSFPPKKDIGRARPRFYHKSFRDFLEDPSRSNEYSIDLKECGSALFWGSQALIETTQDPRSITLSWPNRRGNEDSKWLLTVAVQRMRDVDKGIRRGPSSSGFLIPFYSIEVPVPETRLQSIFESFNNRQLLKEELSITGKLLHDATYESPYKPVLDLLRQGETVKYATLPSLGIDKARLMNSTCTQRALRNRFWSCVLIELDEPASVQGDFEFVDLLLQFYDVAPPIEVAVWESKGSGCCAVITPRDHGISYTSPFSTIFVIVGF